MHAVFQSYNETCEVCTSHFLFLLHLQMPMAVFISTWSPTAFQIFHVLIAVTRPDMTASAARYSRSEPNAEGEISFSSCLLRIVKKKKKCKQRRRGNKHRHAGCLLFIIHACKKCKEECEERLVIWKTKETQQRCAANICSLMAYSWRQPTRLSRLFFFFLVAVFKINKQWPQ